MEGLGLVVDDTTKLFPLKGGERAVDEFFDPAALPDVYGLVVASAFLRKDVDPGDTLLVDRRKAPSVGDVVIVYFRPEAKPANLPLRMVAELATAVPPRKEFAPGSDVQPLLGLFINNDDRAVFLKPGDVIAVDRVYAMQRWLAGPPVG